jgi:hypothetical protein
VFAFICEDEGPTLIVTRADADRSGLAYDYVAARITLRVDSAVARDHLFVPWDQGARALTLLGQWPQAVITAAWPHNGRAKAS